MNIKDEDLHTYVHIAGIAASINCERAGAEPPTRTELSEVFDSLD
jgi:fructokinase